MTAVKPFYFKEGAFYTRMSGARLLNSPLLNKGTAFTLEERSIFKLSGLLPPHIDSLDDQVARAYEAFKMIDQPLEQHVFLRQIQDQNETLFYRLVLEHLEEMMPVIYTPVVGEACQKFSHIYRRPRGLFISYPERNQIAEILENSPRVDVKVIVVTDGERILGLGDQGAGGMGIPIGKLSLYTACGGLNPSHTLPIVLDVGTNNKKLTEDPTYVGWRHERITGEKYYKFVDQFVKAVKNKYPQVLLQFEDFAQPHAYPLLEKYRGQLCMFNDDIQGTASVCVGALLAAVKSLNQRLSAQRVVVVGAGSAGCGISEQLVLAMQREGLSEADARARFYMIDRNGLVVADMPNLMPFQQALAQQRDVLKSWQVKAQENISLLETVANAKPTILLGLSGQPNLFTEDIVMTMAQAVKKPIIFPMSNPTSRSEALPEDLFKWTGGNVLVATGSPFAPVQSKGQVRVIAQSNNCYIFPGMGLAVVAGQLSRVSDDMFMVASIALSELSPALKNPTASLLPPLSKIREVSEHIAIAVIQQGVREGVGKRMSEREIKQVVQKTMWFPKYHKMVYLKKDEAARQGPV